MDDAGNATTYGPIFEGNISSSVQSIAQDTRAQDGGGSAKITNGNAVKQGELPDTVGISSPNGRVSCTGVLIEPDIVLTAAHCVKAGISARVYIGNERDKWTASYAVIRARHGVISQSCGLKCGRDLALLLLEKPVANVTPRAMAPQAAINAAKWYRIAGFGYVDHNASVSTKVKMTAQVVAVSNDCDGSVHGKLDEAAYGCMPGQEIVAGRRGDGTDTCNGDSGGPLYVSADGKTPPKSSSSYLLAGITSRATQYAERACGDGGIYERLTEEARSWINDTEAALRKP